MGDLREDLIRLVERWMREIDLFRKHHAEDDSFIWLLACLAEVEDLLASRPAPSPRSEAESDGDAITYAHRFDRACDVLEGIEWSDGGSEHNHCPMCGCHRSAGHLGSCELAGCLALRSAIRSGRAPVPAESATEEATSAEEVVRAMAQVAARRIGCDPVIGYTMSTAPRPHGRVGFSFPFASTDGFEPDGYVDVSVMPRSAATKGEEDGR